METLGLDRVSSYPSNALYSVNGKEQYSPSNEFILNNSFKITLKNTTPGGPAAISLNTDDNSIADSIEELISGYNSLIAVTASDNHKIFEGNDRLKQEFSRISQTYKTTLNDNGLHIVEFQVYHLFSAHFLLEEQIRNHTRNADPYSHRTEGNHSKIRNCQSTSYIEQCNRKGDIA